MKAYVAPTCKLYRLQITNNSAAPCSMKSTSEDYDCPAYDTGSRLFVFSPENGGCNIKETEEYNGVCYYVPYSSDYVVHDS